MGKCWSMVRSSNSLLTHYLGRSKLIRAFISGGSFPYGTQTSSGNRMVKAFLHYFMKKIDTSPWFCMGAHHTGSIMANNTIIARHKCYISRHQCVKYSS